MTTASNARDEWSCPGQLDARLGVWSSAGPMRLVFALAFLGLSPLAAGCASTVVPNFGDSGPADVPIVVDAVERPDVPARCADFQTSCSNRCVDTQTDPSNCGGCGRACASGSCRA